MGAELFVSEVLKGMSQGFMQGLQLRAERDEKAEDRKLKREELAIREKALLSDTAIKEMEIATKASRAEAEQLKNERAAFLQQMEIERKALKDQLDAEYKNDKLGLQSELGKAKQALEAKDREIDLFKAQTDADYKKDSIKVQREKIQSEEEQAEKDRKSREKIAAMKSRLGKGVDDKTAGIINAKFDKLQQNPLYRRLGTDSIEAERLQGDMAQAKKGNTVAWAHVKAQTAKLKESGRLTDEDVERYGKSGKISRRVKDKLSLWVKGQATMETMDEVHTIINAYQSKINTEKTKMEDTYVKQLSGTYNISPDKIKSAWGLNSKPQTGGTKNAPAVGTVTKGYKFKGGNPADKNNWEKVK